MNQQIVPSYKFTFATKVAVALNVAVVSADMVTHLET